MTKKTVSIQLKEPVTFQVNAKKGMSDKELLELAQKEFIKKIKENFPAFTWSVTDGEALDFETTFQGQLVKTKSEGKYGVVCGKKTGRKFPLDVRLENGQLMQYKPIALEKVEDETIINSFMKDSANDMEVMGFLGETGYLVNNGKIEPIVFGNSTKTTYPVYVISGDAKSTYYSLKAPHLKMIFPTKKQAEENLKLLKK